MIYAAIFLAGVVVGAWAVVVAYIYVMTRDPP